MIFAIRNKFQLLNPPRVFSKWCHQCLFSPSSLNSIPGSVVSTDSHSFTHSFLVNSCGLSLDSAVLASKKLRIETTDQPDLVLKLFKSHGLIQTHVKDLVTRNPLVLRADLNKTLQPNIELLDSFGICGDTLARILKRAPFLLESQTLKLDVELFKEYGFSNQQIIDMFLKQPSVFTFVAEKYIKPKLDFFLSLGFQLSEVAKLFSSVTYILDRSLDNHIIPCVYILKSAVETDENVMKAIKADCVLLRHKLDEAFKPNIKILTKLGVPKPNVLKLILRRPRTLLQSGERFREIIDEVVNFGFYLKDMQFLLAMCCLATNSSSKWEQKLETLATFGIAGDEFSLAFRVQPLFMLLREEKIKEKLDFFGKALKLNSSTISQHSYLLMYSLENKVIPRCSVLQLLMSNNISLPNLSLITILRLSEIRFKHEFVVKYKDLLPGVVKASQGEVEFKCFDERQLLQLVSGHANAYGM